MRRPYIYLLISYCLFMGAVTLKRAVELNSLSLSSPSTWTPHGRRWYDEALGTVFFAFIACTCVVYLVRTGKRNGRATSAPSRWRDRKELRVALYVYAAFVFLQPPIAVLKAIAASKSNLPPWKDSFWSALNLDCIIFAALGVVAIAYDRKRIRREMKQNNECPTCGYDLRATPSRCPECGTVIQN